jgi:hypothetical protein
MSNSNNAMTVHIYDFQYSHITTAIMNAIPNRNGRSVRSNFTIAFELETRDVHSSAVRRCVPGSLVRPL